MELTLNYKTHFDAAHKLINYPGKCKNLHGHRWNVIIRIVGDEKQLKNGILMDFVKIKEVVGKLDHCYLNDIVKQPTAENLAIYLKQELTKLDKNLKYSIKIFESPNASVEI